MLPMAKVGQIVLSLLVGPPKRSELELKKKIGAVSFDNCFNFCSSFSLYRRFALVPFQSRCKFRIKQGSLSIMLFHKQKRHSKIEMPF